MKEEIYIIIVLILYSHIAFSDYGDKLRIRTIEFGQPKYGWFNFPD